VTVDPDSERLDAVESSRCIVLVAALRSAIQRNREHRPLRVAPAGSRRRDFHTETQALKIQRSRPAFRAAAPGALS
jgi:hypothetical protein